MLDGRIYRAGFLFVLIAVVIAALSLGNRPHALYTTLAPDAFDGPWTIQTLDSLARSFPDRPAGGSADDRLAESIAKTIEGLGTPASGGFQVRIRHFEGQTAAGERGLSTVIAERPGSTGASPIVVLAHRDGTRRGSRAELSGTAVLLELARALSSRATTRTIILLSTSAGFGGDAGAAEFAANAPTPVDGVIVLGDLASGDARAPSVVSYSDGLGSAPVALAATVSRAIAQEVGSEPKTPSLAVQFAHLAFPLAVGEQGPLGAHGLAAVLVQIGGERGASPSAPFSQAHLQDFGRAVLSSIDALDQSPDISSAPKPALLLARGEIPAWAIRLLVGALLLPVLLLAADTLARVRRRREPLGRWIGWVLACALPFFTCALLAVALGRVGVIGERPPVPVLARAVGLDASVLATLALLAMSFVLVWLCWPSLLRRLGSSGRPDSLAAGLAVQIVLAAVSVAVWVANPFAAALLLPALHLWIVFVSPELRPRRAFGLALVALGLAAPALLALYYAHELGSGLLSGSWIVVLMLTGGHLGIAAAAAASITAGSAVAVVLVALQGKSHTSGSSEVTIRGPVSYAGPGSLGGTESALRR